MRKQVLAAAAALILCPGSLLADEEGPWSGKVALGFLGISGNTESETLNAEAEVNWTGERWEHHLRGRVIGKTEDKDTTAEAYRLAYEPRWNINERNFIFGLLDYNKDRFSSYRQQIFAIAGVGHRFIITERHKLNGQIGLGYSDNELQTGISQEEPTIRVGGDWNWQISENASFKQVLAINWTDVNTFTESITELRAGIVGNVGMSLSLTVRNNSDVLPGTEKTDTWTAVNIDYAF